MDRPISGTQQRKKRVKWALGVGFGCLALFVCASFLVSAMRPSLKRTNLLTATVEMGPVNAVIETSGVLVPEQEQVLTAPGETRILRIVREPGSFVNQGDPILELDISSLELERDSLLQQLGVKENAKRKAILEYEKLEKQDRAKLELIILDLAYFEAQHKQQAKLFEQGLVSQEALQQAQLQFEKKRVERRQANEAQKDAKTSNQIELSGFDLEIELLKKSLASAEDLLNRATTKAPTKGVLTWVVAGEGTTVRSGEPLARIADLSKFKISATISDYYADRLTVQQEAVVKIGDVELSGRLSRLLPEVNNGVMTFEVKLENKVNIPLRPNQRVSVFLVTAKRNDVLRLRRSATLSSPGQKTVFLLSDQTAVRTQIEIGVTGSNFTEVLSGLKQGDEVILNNLTELNHLRTIPVQ